MRNDDTSRNSWGASAQKIFISRYEEEQWRRNTELFEKAVVREARRSVRNAPVPTEDSQRFIDGWQWTKDAVRLRLTVGFESKHPRLVGGRMRQPFNETGLRSQSDSVALKLFAAVTPRGGSLRTSMNKADLAVQSPSKLLCLDDPWVETNKQFLTNIRIDLDRDFSSPEHCVSELEDYVGTKLPVLPNLIVGDKDDAGRFRRPHLYYLLPYGSAVWSAVTDTRCRPEPVKLFRAVSKGIVAALLPLGADPNAPLLSMRGKNPLGPWWVTINPNDTEYPTLSEWADWVDTKPSRSELVRRSAAIQSGTSVQTSNSIFNAAQTLAYDLMREWHFGGDERAGYLAARKADALHEALASRLDVSDSGMTENQIGLLVAKVADFAVLTWDPRKLDHVPKRRGAFLHEIEGKSTRERRVIAGRLVSKARRNATEEKIAAAVREQRLAGQTVSVQSIATATSLSERNVRNYRTLIYS